MNQNSTLSVLASSSMARGSSAIAPIAGRAVKPLRLGLIGGGSRGQEVLRQFLHVPGVSIEAVCDIYPPRFVQVNRIAGKQVPATADYNELLLRHDIDAVFISSPLAKRAEHVIAPARTGRPIYGEKALGFTPAECQEILSEVKKNKVLFQIGHQYRYAAWAQESIRRVHAGAIGTPTHIYAYWHRNGNWRRAVPSRDPDQKLEHLLNWRLYRETSGGLVTELGSHHIDMANWVFGEQPQSIVGTTSICRYHDRRTVGDNVQAIFLYSRGRRLVFSSITTNAELGCEFWIYGTEGSVQITIEDATFYYEKKTSDAQAPSNKTIVEHGVVTGASYSTANEMPYRGVGEKVSTPPAEDPTLAAVRSFTKAVNGEHGIQADVSVGFRSAIACATAHDVVFTETNTEIRFPVS